MVTHQSAWVWCLGCGRQQRGGQQRGSAPAARCAPLPCLPQPWDPRSPLQMCRGCWRARTRAWAWGTSSCATARCVRRLCACVCACVCHADDMLGACLSPARPAFPAACLLALTCPPASPPPPLSRSAAACWCTWWTAPAQTPWATTARSGRSWSSSIPSWRRSRRWEGDACFLGTFVVVVVVVLRAAQRRAAPGWGGPAPSWRRSLRWVLLCFRCCCADIGFSRGFEPPSSQSRTCIESSLLTPRAPAPTSLTHPPDCGL